MGDTSGTGAIRAQMEVVGADGGHVGTVDKLEGGRIRLAKKQYNPGGQHRYIPVGYVNGVDGDKVRVSFPSAQAPKFWQTAGGQA